MMQHSDQLAIEDLSVVWCNSNAVATSIMEAISFVTPLVENFLISTVAESIAKQHNSELHQRCHSFLREESSHSRLHKKFNAVLLNHLGRTPPGFSWVQFILNGAKKRLSLSKRLLITAALEHFSAVMSKAYLTQETEWNFQSRFAKELFAHHAREELAHRSTIFDLWLSKKHTGWLGRMLIVLAILLTGSVYVMTTAPWILQRKTEKHLPATLLMFTDFIIKNIGNMMRYSLLGELFSFTRADYHPDHLIDDKDIANKVR